MSNKILFIAYFFPPVGGKGLPGVQRTVKFLRRLENWEKYVLTVDPQKYPADFSLQNYAALPVGEDRIYRTGVLDLFGKLVALKNILFRFAGRSISEDTKSTSSDAIYATNAGEGGRSRSLFTRFKDAISGALTFPDFAHAWILPAVFRGTGLVKRRKIKVLFATGMPWSSLLIGVMIKMLTKAKLVVDFRDPWVNNPFLIHGKNSFQKNIEEWVEAWVVSKADLVSLNTEALYREFLRRYPRQPSEKFVCLPNGYDAHDFEKLSLGGDIARKDDRLIMTHAGFLYGLRDPQPIFDALTRIFQQSNNGCSRVLFRQIGDTQLPYDPKKYLENIDLTSCYENMGCMNYTQCLQEMQISDVLIIIQQDTQSQIPSKLYEYIYLEKPILVLASENGALGEMVRKYGFGELYEPDDVGGIVRFIQNKMREKNEHGRIIVDYKHKASFDVQHIAARLESRLNGLVDLKKNIPEFRYQQKDRNRKNSET